jgi:DNA-binding response OmpR family regulator
MTKRILIVDDEPNIVISLEFLMKREGYETAVAPDGEAALAAMAAEPHPDLVILDIMLPKLNGFEVCERIRAEPAWRATKIVMLTAKGRDTDLAKGIRLGADAYVTKPFSTQDLLVSVRRLLAAG